MSWSKNKKKYAIIFLVIAIAGIFGIYKYMYQEHRVIEDVKPKFEGSAEDLFEKISVSQNEWTNQVVLIHGPITDTKDSTCVISEKIFCQLLNGIESLKTGNKAKIKGRVIGYDEVFEEVKLDQCTIQK